MRLGTQRAQGERLQGKKTAFRMRSHAAQELFQSISRIAQEHRGDHFLNIMFGTGKDSVSPQCPIARRAGAGGSDGEAHSPISIL